MNYVLQVVNTITLIFLVATIAHVKVNIHLQLIFITD